tara:strand:+ start:4718 stop:4963 length:246 start_codon:yes stop_codon:yes gene_type:complete
MDSLNRTPSEIAISVAQSICVCDADLPTLSCGDCLEYKKLDKVYKCLYCDIWYCLTCAERHFGKTKEEWIVDKRLENHLED